MTSSVKRILKLGSPMSYPFLSTTECFVFMRGYGFVSAGKEGPDRAALNRVAVALASREPMAGTDAFATAGGASDCSAFSVAE